MKENTEKWEAITARIAIETQPANEGAPFGFATRVVGLWRAAQRDEALRRWSRWSLRAAFCSAAVCGLVVIFSSQENDSAVLLRPPAAGFVSPPLSTP
jgi:hypothetical protein